jgi:hypothetical protein
VLTIASNSLSAVSEVKSDARARLPPVATSIERPPRGRERKIVPSSTAADDAYPSSSSDEEAALVSSITTLARLESRNRNGALCGNF